MTPFYKTIKSEKDATGRQRNVHSVDVNRTETKPEKPQEQTEEDREFKQSRETHRAKSLNEATWR